jgi:hypothetical protein
LLGGAYGSSAADARARATGLREGSGNPEQTYNG